MHGIFLNVTKWTAHFWAGKYFANATLNDALKIPLKDWQSIGKDLTSAIQTVPSAFGGAIRDISVNLQSYKASEAQEWVMLYSMPLLQGRLDPPLLKHWSVLVRGTQLALQTGGLQAGDQEEIARCFALFVKDYERYYFIYHINSPIEAQQLSRLYYQHDYQRLPACRLVFHQLLHVASAVRDFGPLPVYWSFVMERYVGILGGLVRNHSSVNQNMAQSALLMEQRRHVTTKFSLSKSEKDTLRSKASTLLSSEGRVQSTLLTPSKQVILSDAQIKMLASAYKCIFHDEIEVHYDTFLFETI